MIEYDIGDKSLLFKYISLNLKEVYKSDIEVSEEYTIDLAFNIYNFLKLYYPQLHITDGVNSIDATDLAEYYIMGHKPSVNDPTNINGVKLYPIYETYSKLNEKTNTVEDFIIYDTTITNKLDSRLVEPTSIMDLNELNIMSWPLRDNIIQFLQPGVIISSESTLDEIAQAQQQLSLAGYNIPKINNTDILQYGEIDEDFKLYCYNIQNKVKMQDMYAISSGYFDIYVESFTRSIDEVRK